MTEDARAQQAGNGRFSMTRSEEYFGGLERRTMAVSGRTILLVNDNLGLWHHRIETSNLEMVRPTVVKLLHESLIGYPNWEIVIALGDFGGLIISEDEIIDGLRRENLPKEFQMIQYEGSRPQRPHLGEILSSGGEPS
jgi:hypothetical protein